VRVAVVVPNLDGERWLPGLLGSLGEQTRAADVVVVVDNGSRDGSLALLAGRGVRVVPLAANTGFAAAVNTGIAVARAQGCGAAALVNTDVVLEPDWLERCVARLAEDPGVGSVATKMVLLGDGAGGSDGPAGGRDAPPRRALLDDCGDVLRRDGVAEQRGHGRVDDGRWDAPGEVWGASAGAAVYRLAALDAVGGLDETYFAYLEDVDLALRLRLAGWRCAYEPAVAHHARHGTSDGLGGLTTRLVARNTVVLVAKAFPARWLPLVAYRQAAWLAAAAREGRLVDHLRGLAAAVPLLPAALRARRTLRAGASVPIEEAIPARAWRGPAAADHAEGRE